MRQIHTKSDWQYEFRPYYINAVATLGLISIFTQPTTPTLRIICTISSLVLFISAYKISQWRKSYRKWLS